MSIQTKYRILQCCYWMMGCVAWGYCISYLESYGYSTTVIGLIIAFFALGAAVVQPALGRLVDGSERFHWKRLLLIFIVITLLLQVLLLLINSRILVGILFGAFSMAVTTILSMVNVAPVYYNHHGIPVNFGVARGLGSLAYAVLSVILGRLIAPCGVRIILVFGLIITGVMLLLTLSFPWLGFSEQAEDVRTKGKRTGLVALFQKYPAFFLMVIACVLFMTFHDMYTNYLLLILQDVGGGNEALGVALALAAVAEIPVMFASGWLVKRFTSRWLLVLSGAALVVRGFFYYYAASVTAVYLTQLFQIVTFALVASVSVYYTDECMEEEDLATGQSFMGMTIAGGNTIAYLCGGVLIDRFGTDTMLMVGTAISAVGTLLAVISALLDRPRLR